MNSTCGSKRYQHRLKTILRIRSDSGIDPRDLSVRENPDSWDSQSRHIEIL